MSVRKGQNGILKRFSKNKSKRRNGKAEYLYRKCIFYACKSCERDSQKGIVRKETVHNSPFLAIIEELILYIKTSVYLNVMWTRLVSFVLADSNQEPITFEEIAMPDEQDSSPLQDEVLARHKAMADVIEGKIPMDWFFWGLLIDDSTCLTADGKRVARWAVTILQGALGDAFLANVKANAEAKGSSQRVRGIRVQVASRLFVWVHACERCSLGLHQSDTNGLATGTFSTRHQHKPIWSCAEKPAKQSAIK